MILGYLVERETEGDAASAVEICQNAVNRNDITRIKIHGKMKLEYNRRQSENSKLERHEYL